jgi:hypothetical protein
MRLTAELLYFRIRVLTKIPSEPYLPLSYSLRHRGLKRRLIYKSQKRQQASQTQQTQ